MEVTKNGKVLYHIQNMNICSDNSAYDMFLFSDHFPTKEELRKKFAEDFGCDEDDAYADEFCTSSEIYKLYAEEL